MTNPAPTDDRNNELERLRAELAELRITMTGDDRERIDQIQAERDAMPKDERIRAEAADAPMLRIQLACLAGENRRLKDEIERTAQVAAEEIWAKLGLNTILDWKQRAEQAEAAIERVRAAWSEWRERLGGSFPPAMVQEITTALDGES